MNKQKQSQHQLHWTHLITPELLARLLKKDDKVARQLIDLFLHGRIHEELWEMIVSLYRYKAVSI